MHEHEPYCDYRVTVRVEIPNQPGQFARLATTLAEENANLGAIDIVSVNRDRMVRDITFDAKSEAHAKQVVERLRSLSDVRVVSESDRIFLLHLGGKIHTQPKVAIKTRNTLSMAYTPGVARVCRAIAEDKTKAYVFTSKANSVAVVTDGSAILGLGNLGPEAALPVMEGKVMLFKEFADIDGWPLCLATQDVEQIVRTVEAIAPTFGGINLEDITPRAASRSNAACSTRWTSRSCTTISMEQPSWCWPLSSTASRSSASNWIRSRWWSTVWVPPEPPAAGSCWQPAPAI